ncbi:MAG: AAA family ATPase [Acidiferrobacterales bacterium]|nr:AAA family ATPase [Acidiferrobacterales bacterium]
MTEFKPIIHPWNQALWQSLGSDNERSNHALLFTGNKGLGKQALAIALTHFLMCENHAQSKSLFNAGSHPDLHVVMPEVLAEEIIEDSAEDRNIIGQFAKRYLEDHAGKPRQVINIEQVRKLGQALATHPHIASTRIVLIFNADTMNNNAANALLKNLEEPPANTLFVLVTNELSKLPKTIRSRCSLINFRAPDIATGRAWLAESRVVPADLIDSHLAMANNHPLMAESLFKNDYVASLKAIFTDVNGLWSNKIDPINAAKNWQKIGGLTAIEVLQKLTIDLIRSLLGGEESLPSKSVFFPVQQTWIKSISTKLSKQRLIEILDELNYAKKMLATTVDELLVLETVSTKIRRLPI